MENTWIITRVFYQSKSNEELSDILLSQFEERMMMKKMIVIMRSQQNLFPFPHSPPMTMTDDEDNHATDDPLVPHIDMPRPDKSS